MFISFFFVGVGLCLMIGWFDQSLNHLTHTFSYIEEEDQYKEDPLQTMLSSQVINASGDMQSLRDIKGHITLLSFWASWCGPCRVELPTLADLHKAFKDKGLQIIAINLDNEDTDRNDITSLWDAMEMPFSFFSDFEGQTAKAFNVQSLPVHFVLNQYGEVMLTANGANDWSHPRNMQMFQDFLNQ